MSDPCTRYLSLSDRLLAEEPLTPEERLFVAEHPQSCASCAAEARLLDAVAELGPVPTQAAPSEEVLQSILVRSRVVEPGRTRGGPAWLAGMALAATLLLALGGGLVWSLATTTTTTTTTTTAQAPPAAPPCLHLTHLQGQALLDGEPMQVGACWQVHGEVHAHESAVLSFDNGLRLELAPDTFLQARRTEPGATDLSLSQGTAGFQVAPLSEGQHFDVSSAHGTVSVVGTSFSVSVHEETFELEVTEGRVRFVPLQGEAQELGAGEELHQGPDAQPPPPPIERPPRPAPPPSVSSLLDQVQEARGRGDAQAALEAYESLHTHHPDSPEARDAQVGVAQLQLQLQHHQAALDAATAYLAQAPEGSLAEEAAWIRYRSLSGLGRVDTARQVGQDFLLRYPGSAYALVIQAELAGTSQAP